MPFYEYQCSNCDHRLEVLQKISDGPLLFCPECNDPTLKKLVSAAGFRLKGTGWYETDFKGNGKQKEDPKNKTETSKAGSSDKTSDKSSSEKNSKPPTSSNSSSSAA